MEFYKELIGMIGAFCTTFAFVPQLVHVVKTKDTKAISLGMYLVFITGLIAWLFYGIMTSGLPLILANSVTLILASIILSYKLKYK